MPKNLLVSFVKKFRDLLLKSDGKILHCKFCKVKVSATK